MYALSEILYLLAGVIDIFHYSIAKIVNLVEQFSRRVLKCRRLPLVSVGERIDKHLYAFLFDMYLNLCSCLYWVAVLMYPSRFTAVDAHIFAFESLYL